MERKNSPVVRPGDEEVIKNVNRTILEEKIDSPAKLQERFLAEPSYHDVIMRNAKVVAATIEWVRTSSARVKPYRKI